MTIESLKNGGVSRDGHGIKLAYYYLQAHKGGQGAKPTEAESLSSFGN